MSAPCVCVGGGVTQGSECPLRTVVRMSAPWGVTQWSECPLRGGGGVTQCSECPLHGGGVTQWSECPLRGGGGNTVVRMSAPWGG